MEESTMANNPLPDEPTEVIEELQPKPKPAPLTPALQASPQISVAPAGGAGAVSRTSGGSNETRGRKEALTLKFAAEKLNDYLQWLLMVLEAFLLIRFILKMFGADPNNFFATIIFSVTQVLLWPFEGIVPSVSMHANQSFEFSTIFAAVIYFFLFFALRRFIRISTSDPGEAGA
jgi:uncharacterized protein YggT (Ycf19 family)